MLLLWIIYVISVLLLLCFSACLFISALWSPAGKGMTSWLSFVMSNCEVEDILCREGINSVGVIRVKVLIGAIEDISR